MRIVKDEYVYIVKDEYVDRGVESWRMNIRGLSVKDKYVNKLEKYCEVWICKQRGRIKKDEYVNKLRSRILRDEWRENWTSSRQKKSFKIMAGYLELGVDDFTSGIDLWAGVWTKYGNDRDISGLQCQE